MARRAPADSIPEVPAIPDLESQMILFLDKAKKLALPVGIALLVLIVAAVVAVKARTARREAQASAQAALSLALGEPISPFAPVEERQAKYEERITRLKGVITQHSGSQAAISAAYYIARTQYEQGKHKEAAESFAKFVTDYPTQQPLTPLAAMGEANALVDQEQYQEAYDKFVTIGTPGTLTNDVMLVARAKYRAALCAVVLAKPDNARGLLDEVLASQAGQELKDKAQALLDKVDMIKPDDLKRPPEKTAEEAAETPAPAGNSGLQIVPMGGN
jgi:predicted negative regulator of RcsB-dependent stress response